MKPLRIAIIGCGHICHQYGQHILKYPEQLEIAGAYDLDETRARDFCDKYGGKSFQEFEAILADDSVDTILNLTVHHAHFDLNKRALEAGKHVFSEKPMSLSYSEATELIKIAKASGRRLAAAPGTFLGEGVQTASKFLDADKIGQLRLVYAEANWGQIESWISNPAPYYTVGPLLDIGVYAITALTFLLGPVQRVWGYSSILKNPRKDKHGKEFPVTAPDFTTGMMEFKNGVVARLTTNYYVPNKSMRHQKGLEFHGDSGSFVLGCYHNFDPECQHFPYGGEPVGIPLLRKPEATMDRAVGLAEMAEAIHENRPHRCSAEHAAHVIEIMEGLQTSSDEGRRVEIHSEFKSPSRMPWAEHANLESSEATASVE